MSAKSIVKNPEVRLKIIKGLVDAYWKEMETVQNYLAISMNLDGVHAEPIKKSLDADIAEELGHARQLAQRIRVLGGVVPGSKDFKATQDFLQPPKSSTDVVSVIRGVIEAEEGAIEAYAELIEASDGVDYVTQDLCITLMADEEEHRREFLGFLAEYGD